MTAKAQDAPHLSLRWIGAALIGGGFVTAVMLKFGWWLGVAAAFFCVLLLAAGKPFGKYRKLVYRGIAPAGVIGYVVTFVLDYGFSAYIPEPPTRLALAAAFGIMAGWCTVRFVTEVWARARLHWLSVLSPNLDRGESLQFLRSLAFGLNYPVIVIDGTRALTSVEGGPGGFLQKIGGPGLLVVQHGAAVVLEQNGKFKRVAKGGVRFLALYEQPKSVVDLRQQYRRLQVQDALTLDGVLVAVEMSVWYQIKRLTSAAPPVEAPPLRSKQPSSPPSGLRPSTGPAGQPAGGSATSSQSAATDGQQSHMSNWHRLLTWLRDAKRQLCCDAAHLFVRWGQWLAPGMFTVQFTDKGTAANASVSSAEPPHSGHAPDGDGGSTHDTPPGDHDDYIDQAMAQETHEEEVTAHDEFPVDDHDIVHAVYQVDDWQTSLEAVVSHILRDVLAERTLDQLLERDEAHGNWLPRAALRSTVLWRVNQWLEHEQWGVEVVWVDIGNIAIPEAVRSKMLERWLATWEVRIAETQKEAVITRGEATASALSAQEAVRARTSMQLIGSILDTIEDKGGLDRQEAVERLVSLRIIDALEKMASEHTNNLFLPAGLLQILTGQDRLSSEGDGNEARKAS